MAREIDQFLSRLRACGCTARLTRAGHWRVTGPKGGTVTVPQTPSDRRSLRNVRSNIRRYLDLDI